jgi:hypothetical protein
MQEIARNAAYVERVVPEFTREAVFEHSAALVVVREHPVVVSHAVFFASEARIAGRAVTVFGRDDRFVVREAPFLRPNCINFVAMSPFHDTNCIDFARDAGEELRVAAEEVRVDAEERCHAAESSPVARQEPRRAADQQR